MKVSQDGLGRYAEKIRKRAKSKKSAFRYARKLWKFYRKMRRQEYIGFCDLIDWVFEHEDYYLWIGANSRGKYLKEDSK